MNTEERKEKVGNCTKCGNPIYDIVVTHFERTYVLFGSLYGRFVPYKQTREGVERTCKCF